MASSLAEVPHAEPLSSDTPVSITRWLLPMRWWLRTLLALPRSAPGATSKPVAPAGRSADSLRRGFIMSDAGRTTAGPRACTAHVRRTRK